MVPGNSREAQMAVGLEPWLKEQFTANVPYDELARKLVTATNDGQQMLPVNSRRGVQAGGPALFFQAVGGKPETAASSEVWRLPLRKTSQPLRVSTPRPS